MSKSKLTLKINKKLRKDSEELFEDLGLDLQTALTIFLAQSIRVGGIPFEITKITPTDRKIQKALEEALNSNSPEVSAIEKLLNEINQMYEE